MKDRALKVAGAVFTVLAILQMTRLIFRVEVTAGGATVPLWLSVLAVAILSALAVWMFKSLK